jgi:predicted dehydrogenase
MGSARLKLGIAGLGKMGQLHLKKAVNNCDVELTGMYDIDVNKSLRSGSEWGVRSCRNYEELLFESDALIISTSTESHFPLAIKALDHELALFIEKPICESVEKAESLLRLAREKNIPIQTGFVERFCWKKLLESRPSLFNKPPNLISTERCSSTPSREKGLDIVSDLMIHDIDFVLWSLSEPPISIAAEGVSVGVSPIDIAFARLEFASGAIAHLKAAWVLTENKRTTQVSWEDGLLCFDLSNRKAQYTSTEKQIDEICLQELDPLSEQMNSFVQSVISERSCVVDGWDGLKAIEISDLIKRQILDRNTSTTVFTERERKFLLKSWSTDVS